MSDEHQKTSWPDAFMLVGIWFALVAALWVITH